MKNAKGIVVIALALVLGAIVWGLPSASYAKAHAAVMTEQTPAAPQTVSGKIASVTKDSFTLTVAPNKTAGQQLAQADAGQTMTFQIDKNTTIEGKLKVNASAEVTYRVENANNIAISVHVTP